LLKDLEGKKEFCFLHPGNPNTYKQIQSNPLLQRKTDKPNNFSWLTQLNDEMQNISQLSGLVHHPEFYN
jgi:hypothetical protein